MSFENQPRWHRLQTINTMYSFKNFFTGSHILIDDMLDELEIHLKLEEKHENVVNLIGVCSSSDGIYIATLKDYYHTTVLRVQFSVAVSQ